MFGALKFEQKLTVRWTVSCKADRKVDRKYTIKLNLAGGLGGRGPERRGGELKKLCFPYVSYLSGGGRGAGNPVHV